MKRDDFATYKGQHYLPEATVMVVAGAVSEKRSARRDQENFCQDSPRK